MSRLTGLARDVAANAWPLAAVRSRQGWRWLRRNPLWSAGGLVALVLLLLLITHWNQYKKQREAFTPLFTLVAGLAIAGVTLLRHFAQTDADRQRRITDSFSKATEQLGSDKIEVRLGGIYTLERISKESADDYWTVMETLAAFVRERASWQETARRVSELAYFLWQEAGRPDGRADEHWRQAVRTTERTEPPTDIAAVLTVIRRRDPANYEREKQIGWEFDLTGTDLRGADLLEVHLDGANLREAHLDGAYLGGAHLDRANLRAAHLDGAYLEGAHLDGAYLREAHLAGANLRFAHLERARLDGAHLDGANLEEAHLEGAGLFAAHLDGADLGDAHLEGANLEGAHLAGANLDDAHLAGADLEDADLEGADLRGAKGLTQAQLDAAWGDEKTLLPAGLRRPARWTEPEDEDEDEDGPQAPAGAR